MEQAGLLGTVGDERRIQTAGADLDEARVLVVEDDDAMRAFLDESLREEGYVVRTASSTYTGFLTLLGDPIDVLVVDWKMPALDGFALLSAVRRCYPEIPVIFVTAFARPDVARRALLSGAFAFLPKPFRLSVLVAEIQRALNAGPPQGGERGDPSAWQRPSRSAARRDGPDREGPIDPPDRAASE
ncbi:MAG TPA: response regulator [Candidatus Polarisedimenticolia bacterium]|jgi:DNA-binding response OmpR family regulator|nr:response regulator [Candidatus Polarisedimenticolia bacterium]